MKPQKLFRAALAFVLIPLGLYLAAAAILGHIPVNADWREPETGITIYIQTNGVHTGIVLPAVAQGIDWRSRIRASDLPDPRGAGQWLAFGWGDRGFYIDTPTWRQARLPTIVYRADRQRQHGDARRSSRPVRRRRKLASAQAPP